MAIGVQTDMATQARTKHGAAEGGDRDTASTSRITNGTRVALLTRARGGSSARRLNTSAHALHQPLSRLRFPLKTKAFRVTRGRSAQATEPVFEDVRVPQLHRVDDDGLGFADRSKQFPEERMWAIAASRALLEQTLAETVTYTRGCIARRRPLLDQARIGLPSPAPRAGREALKLLFSRAILQCSRRRPGALLASRDELDVGRSSRERSDRCSHRAAERAS